MSSRIRFGQVAALAAAVVAGGAFMVAGPASGASTTPGPTTEAPTPTATTAPPVTATPAPARPARPAAPVRTRPGFTG